MKKRKQVLSTLLVLAMTGTMLAGCGQEQTKNNTAEGSESSVVTSSVQESSEQVVEEDPKDSQRISEETIEITIAGQWNGGTKDWNSTVQFAEYESRLGLKFDATVYDPDQWKSKTTLMFASDDLPDMLCFAHMTAGEVADYGKDGYLLDFSQYLDIMPNLSRFLEEYPEYTDVITMEDGGIYGFPLMKLTDDSSFLITCYINKRWCENVGLDLPDTLDELYEVLVAFKEKDANGNGDPNDEIPFAISSTDLGATYPISWSFGMPQKSAGGFLLVDDNNQVVVGEATENYKEFLRFMNKLYTEGLMNEDAFVVSNDEVDLLFQEDKLGVYRTWSPYPGDAAADLRVLTGLINEPYTSSKTIARSNRVSTAFDLMVNANTKYPEEIAKFVDYLFTEEGSVSGRAGYEGASFDYVEINGSKVIDHTKYEEAFGYEGHDFVHEVAVANSCFNLVNYSSGDITSVLSEAKTEDLLTGECWEQAGVTALQEYALRQENVEMVPQYPVVIYTDEESSERATLRTDIVSYIQSMRAQFIMGEADIDTDWDSYIAKLNEMGLERLEEIEQAAYDRLYK